MANARLGWFSPLGLAASIRVAAGRVGLRAHCFRFSACPASELPLGELAFGLTASAFRHAPLRKLPSAGWFFRWAGWPSGSRLPLFDTHRFGVAAGRVGLRVHCFRFSACTDSEWPLGGLAFGLIASAFRHAPLWSCPRRVGSSAGRVGLRAHDFRFSARTASELPLGGLAFGLTVSAFRHAPLRDCPRRVDLRTPDFRFSVCAASGLPSAS